MSSRIALVCCLLLLSVFCRLALADNYSEYGSVSQTHADGSHDIGYYDTDTDPIYNGWIHVVAEGVDAWIAVDPNASWDDIPVKQPRVKYCTFTTPQCKGRVKCDTDQVSCTRTVYIQNPQGQVIDTIVCNAVCE